MWTIVTPTGDVVATYQVERHAVLRMALARQRKEAGSYEWKIVKRR